MYIIPDGTSFEDYAMQLVQSVKVGEFNAKAFILSTLYKGSKFDIRFISLIPVNESGHLNFLLLDYTQQRLDYFARADIPFVIVSRVVRDYLKARMIPGQQQPVVQISNGEYDGWIATFAHPMTSVLLTGFVGSVSVVLVCWAAISLYRSVQSRGWQVNAMNLVLILQIIAETSMSSSLFLRN